MQLSGCWLSLRMKYTLSQLHFGPHGTPGVNIGFIEFCWLIQFLNDFRVLKETMAVKSYTETMPPSLHTKNLGKEG